MNKIILISFVFMFALVATVSAVEYGIEDLKINELVSIPSSGSDWVEIYYDFGTSGIDLLQPLLKKVF